MKLIDTTTGKVLADITTNHSMSIDEILALMDYTIDNETGEIIDGQTGTGSFFEDLDIE